MNDQTIKEVVEDLSSSLIGRTWGKVFQLSRTSIAVDFRAGSGQYLLVSVEPNASRLHFIKRTVRELEKASITPSPSVLSLRKRLGSARLTSISKDEGDRVVRFGFESEDAVGNIERTTLIAQLTGRTANLFILDSDGRILERFRSASGEGQQIGELYLTPVASQPTPATAAHKTPVERGQYKSISEALDAYHLERERKQAFDRRATAAMAKLKQEIAKREKLARNLAQDLETHGDAEEHKKFGDLLLANIATADRVGSIVRLTDFYADGAPTIAIEVDEGRSLQQEAARRFALYGKARRASREVAERIEKNVRELAELEAKRTRLVDIVARRDDSALEEFIGPPDAKSRGAERKGARREPKVEKISGVRRYLSTDGYEVLVGRGPRENDHLTFRIARSNDTWLHTADYPGSHVVIRNHLRDRDVPHRTLIEAAQLAAQFSQARKDAKVAVNYTERKYVSKIKGGAPGLVRLSSFRTLMVEPREVLERL
jgi:predicted ribosome quality control (RQC) complex YloA/Tae2 family protein